MITRHDIFFTGEEVNAQGIKGTLFVSTVVSEEPETTFEQLLSGLAHEIKNPLVAIKTFTQLLSERFDDAEFRKQFYQIVGKSIDRIEWLTKRVLDYANFLETRLIPVNFPALLDHIITQHQTALRTKKITVQREGLESLSSSTVLSDPRQLSYILENIIVHCVSDLPEGSHVVFSARISHLEAKERERFPFKDLLTDRMVELNITCPSLTHVSPTSVPVALPSTRIYSLELFLSQVIVNRNLGIMERTMDQVGTVITIKMPADECLPKEMRREENSDCR
jgi:NADH:ubiquinone oxidoreductase subunit